MFTRIRPCNVQRSTMEKLAKENFAPSKVWSHKVTTDTLKGYRDSWEASVFLSHQAAWPNVSEQLMYEITTSSNFVTYIHRRHDGVMDAAAVLKIRSRNGDKICWIEFIRGLQSPEAPSEDSKQLGPVPSLMAALHNKLGLFYDTIILQVHKSNKHAAKRFKMYGFCLSKEFDNQRHHLLGMMKRPTDPSQLKQCKQRKAEEGRQRVRATSLRRAQEAREMKKWSEGCKRPRREVCRNKNYCFDEPEIVGARDLLPNWAQMNKKLRVAIC